MIQTTVQPNAWRTLMVRDSRCRTLRSSTRTLRKITKKPPQTIQFMADNPARYRAGLYLNAGRMVLTVRTRDPSGDRIEFGFALRRHQIDGLQLHIQRQRCGDEDRGEGTHQHADYDGQ